MSFLVKLFEKADVKSMMQGVDPESIIQVLVKIMDTSETLKALSDNDKQALIRIQQERAVSSFEKLQRNIKEFREAVNDKEDRVVWGVRWLKIAHIYYIWSDVKRKWDVNDVNWQTALVNHYSFAKKMNNRNRVGFEDGVLSFWVQPWGHGDRLIENCRHYHSLGVNTIEEIVYQYQSPSVLYSVFNQLEEEWKSRFDRFIDWNDTDRVIKWYDNKKYAWVMLDRASCRDEGGAMGHCGNSPRSHTDDRILSFRKFIVEGDNKYWEPHLTFILMKGGKLHEMKGRNNEKPKEKYHPYIVDLLMMEDLVTEIVGGGYLPENNFALSDLDDDVKEKLLSKRPDLMHPLERWESSSNDPEAVELFKSYLEERHDNIVSVTSSWVQFDTDETIGDLEYVANSNKRSFISHAQKVGMDANTARRLFNLLTELLANNHDYEDIIEWLAENDEVVFDREDMMTKIIQSLFKTGDRKLIKAFKRELKKIGGDMEGVQQEFDFISREEKLMSEVRSMARILIANDYEFDIRISEQLIINALLEFCEGVLYSLNYGYNNPYIDMNRVEPKLPINDTRITCDTSFSDDMPDLEGGLDDQIYYILNNQLDGTGETPNWFGGSDSWRYDWQPEYMRLLGEYLYENKFDTSLLNTVSDRRKFKSPKDSNREWIKLAYSALPDNLKK